MSAEVIQMRTARCPLTAINEATGERVEIASVTFRELGDRISATDNRGDLIFTARKPPEAA